MFTIAVAACVPQLPAPDQQATTDDHAATERAIASLPGVRRAAITATAAAITVAPHTDGAMLRNDVARLAHLAPNSIVIQTEAPTLELRHFGPWTMAASSVWPFTAAAVALLAVLALGAGVLAWCLRPTRRPQRS